VDEVQLKVSVVIPVYNPGPYIGDCIRSMIGQSLPAAEYEVVFVDDGSTDDTPALLDKIAAEHANIRVVHEQNSGWSGRPRNVGIDCSQGEYVMFVDHDDSLGAQALERMYKYGTAHNADIVIGKMAGKGRAVPRELFSRNRPHATLADDPLIDSLTPHKMFRRAFLTENKLRFPEGRRRLEDHVFVAHAYLVADRISVLSDYVCYYHVRRDDAGNAGFRPLEPAGYFANLREALAIVAEHTEPGPLRDKLLRRWLRVEMVERLRGARLLNAPPDYRRALLAEIQAVMRDYMGPSVAAGLPAPQRVVADLAAGGRLADLETLADWEKRIGVWCHLDDLHWHDATLRIGFSAQLRVDGEPVTARISAGRTTVDPPLLPSALVALYREHELTGRALPANARAALVLRNRATGAEFVLPAECSVAGGPEALVHGAVVLDPATALSGRPLENGAWDFWVRLHSLGWTKDARIGARRSAEASGEHAEKGFSAAGRPRMVLPYWTTPQGNLSLRVRKQAAPRAAPGNAPALSRRVARRLPAPVKGGLRRVRRLIRAFGK
jgi:glycosyltransferase involved in cell wall biosynthesis